MNKTAKIYRMYNGQYYVSNGARIVGINLTKERALQCFKDCHNKPAKNYSLVWLVLFASIIWETIAHFIV